MFKRYQGLNRKRMWNQSRLFTANFSIRRSLSTFPTLSAAVRSQAGSRKSRGLRKENLLPGVLYGVDDDGNTLKIMVAVDKTTIQKEIKVRGKTFENTLFELNVQSDGVTSKQLVLPQNTQLCALTQQPLSVNFLRYRPGVRVSIPLDFVNQDRSADLKRGSFIFRVNKYIDCVCDEEIPSSIPVDVSDAGPGKVYRLNNISFPPKVRPAKTVPPDFVACVVKTPKG